MSATIRFNQRKDKDFYRTLNKRVYGYFRESGKSPFANASMVTKTVIMFLLYFVPYALIISGLLPLWGMWLATFFMGVGAAGIGMSVMHDANHGSYSKNPRVNRLIGYALNLVGGSRQTWVIQHNLLHHTYTNIPNVDEDIDGGGVIRLNIERPKRKIFRLQHIYAWFLYGIMTLTWVTMKDVRQVIRYKKRGLKSEKNENFRKELIILIISKVFYYLYILVLPMLLLDITIWQWLLGFLTLHLTTGFILSVTFQLAHVVEETNQYIPDEKNQIESAWAVHQLNTTANFAKKSKILNWYLGGLNFQVEHHLFSNICHVHYPKISKIVKNTAQEFNIPYHEYPTMTSAIASHYRSLKKLGKGDM